MREEEKQLMKKVMPNYDDFNLKTSWSMKKKFVFALPGKKRFVSQCVKNSDAATFCGLVSKFGQKKEKEESLAVTSKVTSILPSTK